MARRRDIIYCCGSVTNTSRCSATARSL